MAVLLFKWLGCGNNLNGGKSHNHNNCFIQSQVKRSMYFKTEPLDQLNSENDIKQLFKENKQKT